jgi:hypothetical protein
LIIGFLEGSDIQKAYINFTNFFNFLGLKNINIELIKKTYDKSNNLVLTFISTNKQIRI